MNNIPVTIAIVNYKGLSDYFFYQSLNSALSQIGIRYAIHVYNEKESVIKECSSEKIVIREIPENISDNIVKIREFIVDDINTPYIAFWDSDDIYSVTRLYNQYKKIEEKNLDICFSNFTFFDEEKIYKEDFFRLIGYGRRPINIFDENYIGLGIVTAKVSFLQALKPFPSLKTLDWWIAIKSSLMKVRIDCSNEINGYYRIHKNSLSNFFLGPRKKDFADEIKAKLELYKILSEENKDFIDRYNYYLNITIDKDYEIFKNDFQKRRYKNIWGGLIQYYE